MTKPSFSRRNFVKKGIVSTSALVATGAIVSCANEKKSKKEPFPIFKNDQYKVEDGEVGLLFSQVGYDAGRPVRVVVRLPEKHFLPELVKCILTPTYQETEHAAECKYWGEVWKCHWWVAEFPPIYEEGIWDIEIQNGSKTVLKDYGLKVKKEILWESTIEWSSVDMLFRRRPFPKVGAGWQDAGSLWAESPAQTAAIIALEELIELRKSSIDETFQKRIQDEIVWGCNYLILTQNKASELGFPKGAMSHDVLTHQKDILPHDVSKAVIALLKASRILSESYSAKKVAYKKAAIISLKWLLKTAKPMGDFGYVKMQRGLADDAHIPKDEWPTRDLISMLRVALEMLKADIPDGKELAFNYARQIMARQVLKENAQSGFYGHFYEYGSLDHAEPSWTHGIVPGSEGSQFGTDMGGIYPNYLVPFVELIETFPKHKDASNWKQTLENFAFGYLIPGCEANPFYLVPQLITKKEGPIWFCGTFHGTNCIYGYTAALALELFKVIAEPKLKTIAYGNLQWLAGLNAGITKEALNKGCVIFSADVPEGAALPASMICHIGERWAGTWFQTRGIICNGFSTGNQFVYDVEPKKEYDGPFSFTDEDWIPHSAGWLTGLMRL